MLQQFLEEKGFVLLDGGLATELEGRGFDLRDRLWSTKVLLEEPAAIEAVHAAYLEAGADVIATATYQATMQALVERGFSKRDSAELLLKAVQLAQNAVRKQGGKALVAASIGPYGAYLANGAEYTGDYDLDRTGLVAFHRPRFEVLAGSSADFLIFETIPSFVEIEAIAELLAETPKRTALISFSCRDEHRISDGTPLRECARLIRKHLQFTAIGINCTHPRFVTSLIEEIRAVCTLPIAVYPNRGESWDAANHCWVPGTSATDAEFAGFSAEWLTAGATIIGGCCRTTPDTIALLRQLR